MDLNTAIIRKLQESASDALQTSDSKRLVDDFQGLDQNSSCERQLAVYRALRDSGMLPLSVSFMLIANVPNSDEEVNREFEYRSRDYSEARVDLTYRLLATVREFLSEQAIPEEDARDAIKSALEYLPGERLNFAASESQLLRQLEADCLRRLGETEMAKMLEQNEAAYKQKCEDAERFLFGCTLHEHCLSEMAREAHPSLNQ